MKKIILVTLLLLVNQVILISQPCLPDGITFTTQEQIDDFQDNYPGCSEIEGDLIISGSEISNLNGLTSISSIGGSLLIYLNFSLSSLDGLNNLTFIGGYISIDYNVELTSLEGLENLTSIGGYLSIFSNSALSGLNMLNSLTTIGGYLNIITNESLESLSGLENLTLISGGIFIYDNLSLTNLNGLENVNTDSLDYVSIWDNTSLAVCDAGSICDFLASPTGSVTIYNNAPGCNNPPEIANACGITLPCLPYGNYHFNTQYDIDNFQTNYPNCIELGGYVSISGNDIINLDGLSGVTSISEYLEIRDNENLTDMSGLETLTSIGGALTIINNPALSSLNGLQNINANLISDLQITDNTSLSDCEVSSLCDYLASPSGSVTILNNAAGCNNPTEVAAACGITLPCLPFGNYYFNDQENIDNFQTFYPGCNELAGLVEINGSDITNLNGLNNVTSIGDGGLHLVDNISLTDLSGLNNLTSIGGDLLIYNNTLESLSGIEALTSIGGNLNFDNNESLISLLGLNNLNSIGGHLSISNNNELTSLSGLNNIDAGSISHIKITDNPLLASCEVKSVCDYLSSSNGNIFISDNATGCNSQQEVQAECDEASINENYLLNNLTISPNPFIQSTTIEFELLEPTNIELIIFNHLGVEVYSISEKKYQGHQEINWKAENLPSGVYFCVLKTREGIQTKKLIKVN